MGSKKCSKCGKIKPLTEFYLRENRPIGVIPTCKSCSIERRQKYGLTTTAIWKILQKRNATISKIDFELWYNKQEKVCHYCGIPEKEWQRQVSKSNKKKYARRLTIDRKDNNRGYTPDNMVLACLYCNRVKNELFTEKEMLEIGLKYIKPKWYKRKEN